MVITKVPTALDDKRSTYRAETPDGFCEFSFWGDRDGEVAVTSWRGSLWPSEMPELFVHRRTSVHTGPYLRADVALGAE